MAVVNDPDTEDGTMKFVGPTAGFAIPAYYAQCQTLIKKSCEYAY
jgi:hypothetical protein